MEPRDEREVTDEQVRQEQLQAVNQWAHWAYMITVVGLGFVAMVALIAVLGASTG